MNNQVTKLKRMNGDIMLQSIISGEPKQCNGVHSDCGENATIKVTTQSGKLVYLCGECAEEYHNYLLYIGWKTQSNDHQ